MNYSMDKKVRKNKKEKNEVLKELRPKKTEEPIKEKKKGGTK